MPHKRLQHPATQLVRLRIERGLTRPQLANQAGVPLGSIRHAEVEGGIPSPDTQVKIAGVLGVASPLELWPLVEDDEHELERVA